MVSELILIRNKPEDLIVKEKDCLMTLILAQVYLIRKAERYDSFWQKVLTTVDKPT
jgi:uncharacterized membrane protein (DUF485 family)